MPARSVCLVTLSLSEAGPGRFGRQVSVTDIYHAMHALPCQFMVRSAISTMHAMPCHAVDATIGYARL